MSRRAIAALEGPPSLQALHNGQPVAVGFAAPLFVPVPENPDMLGTQRPCDKGSPPWSSSVGASVLATAMVQIPWVLQHIREHVPDVRVHVRWESFAEDRSGILLWEAFVSGAAKGETHEEDAHSGVQAFTDQLPTPATRLPMRRRGRSHWSPLRRSGRASICRPRICDVHAYSFARRHQSSCRAKQR